MPLGSTSVLPFAVSPTLAGSADRDLVAVHRTVQVRSQNRHVDSLAAIVRAALLQPLDKNGDAVLRTTARSLPTP
jgi:hypothetical protein